MLLANQVDNDSKHEVDEVDSTLDDVLLGLRQALGWVPSSTLQEEIMDAAVQLTVKLAEVFSAVSLGNAVLLALVVGVVRVGAALALASAELLKRLLAVDVGWGNQSHDLWLREIGGPLGSSSLLSGEGLLPRALSRVGRRRGSRDVVTTRPWRLELKGVLGAGSAGRESLLDMEGVEGPARQRIHAGERRQATVVTQIRASHGSGRFQRTSDYIRMRCRGTSNYQYSRERAASLNIITGSHRSHFLIHHGRSSSKDIVRMG